MVKDTKWWLVKVTASAKNVDQWSDKLVPAVMHKAREEMLLVHMRSTFMLVITDKGLSKGHLTSVRRHYKNNSTADWCHSEVWKISVFKVFIFLKFWSMHGNVMENSGLPWCEAPLLDRWFLATLFVDLKPFKMKATNSLKMSGPTNQATQHHIP